MTAPDRPTIIREPLPDISYDNNVIHDAEQVPVQVAWARVMADVESIRKSDRRDDFGGRYNFRGVDTVVNAVGPAMRRHGVVMLPVDIKSIEYVETRTSKCAAMTEVRMVVGWEVTGPKGDKLPIFYSIGQANDTSDKGASKATSVAQRTAFLSALHIPTDDPDIDRGHERGERPVPRAVDYVDEICNPRTSPARLRQIWTELNRHGLTGAMVTNETGDDEAVGAMVTRIGRERTPAGGAA
jgi:hypothetical protein